MKEHYGKEHYGWAWTRTSRDDLRDRLAVVDLQPLAAGDLQLARIEAELVQDRGVDVGDVVAVLDGVEADLVGRAVDDAALHPAAGHPDGEAEDVMVAAVGIPASPGVRPNSVAKTTSVSSSRPRRSRSFSSAAIGWSTASAVARVIGFEAAVGVPGAGAAAAVLDLNEAHAALDQPPRRQQLHAEVAAVRLVEAVERLGRRRLLGEVDHLGHRPSACGRPARTTRCGPPAPDRRDTRRRAAR